MKNKIVDSEALKAALSALRGNTPSSCLSGTVNITSPDAVSTLTKALDGAAVGDMRFFIISDSAGIVPSLAGETCVTACPEVCKLFMADSLGASVGDLVVCAKVKVGLLPVSVYRVMPLNDVKSSSGNFPGAAGLSSPWDKSRINKVDSIESAAGSALKKAEDALNRLPSRGESNMDNCLTTGVYPWCTLGRPPGSAWNYTLFVNRSTTADGNGFYTVEQTAFGRNAGDGLVYKRIIFDKEGDRQFGSWIRIDSIGMADVDRAQSERLRIDMSFLLSGGEDSDCVKADYSDPGNPVFIFDGNSYSFVEAASFYWSTITNALNDVASNADLAVSQSGDAVRLVNENKKEIDEKISRALYPENIWESFDWDSHIFMSDHRDGINTGYVTPASLYDNYSKYLGETEESRAELSKILGYCKDQESVEVVMTGQDYPYSRIRLTAKDGVNESVAYPLALEYITKSAVPKLALCVEEDLLNCLPICAETDEFENTNGATNNTFLDESYHYAAIGADGNWRVYGRVLSLNSGDPMIYQLPPDTLLTDSLGYLRPGLVFFLISTPELRPGYESVHNLKRARYSDHQYWQYSLDDIMESYDPERITLDIGDLPE